MSSGTDAPRSLRRRQRSRSLGSSRAVSSKARVRSPRKRSVSVGESPAVGGRGGGVAGAEVSSRSDTFELGGEGGLPLPTLSPPSPEGGGTGLSAFCAGQFMGAVLGAGEAGFRRSRGGSVRRSAASPWDRLTARSARSKRARRALCRARAASRRAELRVYPERRGTRWPCWARRSQVAGSKMSTRAGPACSSR